MISQSNEEIVVTRLEVIDWRDGATEARRLVILPQKDPFEVEFDLQDDGRTLKIFMKDTD